MRAILHTAHSRRMDTLQPDLVSQRHARSAIHRSRAIAYTLACDVMFLLVATGVGLMLQVIAILAWPAAGSNFDKLIVSTLPVGCLVGCWLFFSVRDGIWGTQPGRFVPFEYTRSVCQHVYLRRLEISLWAIAANTTLIYLCLAFVRTPFFSKFFLASVMALVLVAIRKSIPSRHWAFLASVGMFGLSLGVLAIASMIMN